MAHRFARCRSLHALALFADIAPMGAWGAKAFENDSALDWFAELDGTEALRATLTSVAGMSEEDYLDVDEGSAAIAAAEIIAAAICGKTDRLPEKVIDWNDEHAQKFATADAQLARHAVERVLCKSSELLCLWSESDTDSPWHRNVHLLLECLIEMAGPDSEIQNRREPKFKNEKAALFAFLQMRGLEPTYMQQACIEASGDLKEIRRWLSLVLTASSIEELLSESIQRL